MADHRNPLSDVRKSFYQFTESINCHATKSFVNLNGSFIPENLRVSTNLNFYYRDSILFHGRDQIPCHVSI